MIGLRGKIANKSMMKNVLMSYLVGRKKMARKSRKFKHFDMTKRYGPNPPRDPIANREAVPLNRHPNQNLLRAKGI